MGASPIASSFFHDEPSVRAMNLMDFDVGTLGNHEFDEGGDELVRLLRGGQRRDGLQFRRDEHGRPVNTSAPDFEGVRFPYIAANTVDHEGQLRLPPDAHRRARGRTHRVHRRDHARDSRLPLGPAQGALRLPRHLRRR